ncbi:hypothetical protein PR048_033762 [Dryococelus australis]|uniref:Uncharacterized protein n=1 Tax=Dryococelus australis TaxID=614101 RepID=A0ABQ9FZ07_9NEOP|nr:hypothetical protein PR048_033762 [Dryococelus australis]
MSEGGERWESEGEIEVALNRFRKMQFPVGGIHRLLRRGNYEALLGQGTGAQKLGGEKGDRGNGFENKGAPAIGGGGPPQGKVARTKAPRQAPPGPHPGGGGKPNAGAGTGGETPLPKKPPPEKGTEGGAFFRGGAKGLEREFQGTDLAPRARGGLGGLFAGKGGVKGAKPSWGGSSLGKLVYLVDCLCCPSLTAVLGPAPLAAESRTAAGERWEEKKLGTDSTVRGTNRSAFAASDLVAATVGRPHDKNKMFLGCALGHFSRWFSLVRCRSVTSETHHVRKGVKRWGKVEGGKSKSALKPCRDCSFPSRGESTGCCAKGKNYAERCWGQVLQYNILGCCDGITWQLKVLETGGEMQPVITKKTRNHPHDTSPAGYPQ